MTPLYRPLGWSLFLVADEGPPVDPDKWVSVETDPTVLAQQLRDAIPVDDDVLKSFAAYVDWGQCGPFSYLKRHTSLYIPDRDGPIVVNEIDLDSGMKRCWGVGTFIGQFSGAPLINVRKNGKKRVHL